MLGSRGCRFYQPDFLVGFQCCSMQTGQGFEANNLQQTYIIFVRSGSIEADFNEHKGTRAGAGQMIFFPRASDCCVRALEPSEVLLFGYNNHLQLCIKLMLEQLEPRLQEVSFEFRPMHICPVMDKLLDSVESYVKDQVDCACLYELKQQEITYILHHYYTPDEKLRFFYPAIGKDLDFRARVLSNYLSVRTAEELARACGYGVKNFHRIFLEQFGTPPYRWMQQQWAGHIRGKLLDPRIPIKAIVAEYGFSSQAHLNSYCKRFLGATPVQIRNGLLTFEVADKPQAHHVDP